MLLILLEALLALVLLVAIVWWTMFSGRKGGEPPRGEDESSGAVREDGLPDAEDAKVTQKAQKSQEH
jgi:cytoskeletal protein RodZ